MSGKIVQLNEEIIKGQLKELVRGSVEETLNELLEKAGYQTRSGKRFQVSTIKSILGNRPLYEGMYKYGDMNWVKGVHEPILKGVGEE